MTDLKNPQDLDDTQLTELVVDLQITVGGQDAGTITLEFWPAEAPATVRNFMRYVAEGFYDGKTFHRVIPDFMIQGGCPQGSGMGSGPNGNVAAEFGDAAARSHKRGVVSMARSADPNSASSQFFICHGDANFLDGQYASFGKMVSGEETLDKVAAVPTGGQDRPTSDCTIKAATLRSRI